MLRFTIFKPTAIRNTGKSKQKSIEWWGSNWQPSSSEGRAFTDWASSASYKCINCVSLIIVKKLTASLAWCSWVSDSCPWESAARRWIVWDFNNFCCDKKSVDLRRLWSWPWPWSECSSLEDDAVNGSPILSAFVIFSKSSSKRWVLLPKISFKKNSLDGNFDSVPLCACPSSIQNPWTRWKIMLAEAFSKSCWSRDFSSAPWCSSCAWPFSSCAWPCSSCAWPCSSCAWPCSSCAWPCSSSSCSSSFTSLKMLFAEKHWRRRTQQLI